LTEKLHRCSWAEASPLEQRYHDTEWGVPLHDDRKLFELVTLEGAQAGLSWSTILKKRDNYRKLFDDFDVEAIARYDRRKLVILQKNPGIVRNRLKIASTVSNARAFIEIQKEYGSFDDYIWRFTDNHTIVNKWQRIDEIPTRSTISDAMSAALKKRGFRFVGSTICYAFMQATGMVNDHVVDCFRHMECQAYK